MAVEQCNNCDIVERENKRLRIMVLELQQRIKILMDNEKKVIQTIAKAAKVKIKGKDFILPGEKKYSIEGPPEDRTQELLSKIDKMMSLVDENTAIKFQGILDGLRPEDLLELGEYMLDCESYDDILAWIQQRKQGNLS